MLKAQGGMLLIAVIGAFVAAAMTATATAPVVRADDPRSPISWSRCRVTSRSAKRHSLLPTPISPTVT